MKQLTNKTIIPYEHPSRYNTIPYYYNILDGKYVRGLAKNLSGEGEYTLHNITQTDTLDSLAFKYYGRPDLFWVIANFNGIQDCFINLYEKYNYLYIPEYSTIRFKD